MHMKGLERNINRRTCLIALYQDFSKAFDKINHSILLDKQEHIEIRSIAGKWFASHLENPSHYVSNGEVKPENVPLERDYCRDQNCHQSYFHYA